MSDSNYFRVTATHTRKINVYPLNMRGGIRL